MLTCQQPMHLGRLEPMLGYAMHAPGDVRMHGFTPSTLSHTLPQPGLSCGYALSFACVWMHLLGTLLGLCQVFEL